MTREEAVSLREYVDSRLEALEEAARADREVNRERFQAIREAAALEATTTAQTVAFGAQNRILAISIGVTAFATLLSTVVSIILHFIH